MTQPVIPDETERLRIFLREAREVQDQLRADKAELLAATKLALDVVENPYRFSDDDAAAAYDNLKAVFAKHEARDAA